MTRRLEVEHRRRNLAEIRAIMHSMQTLAYIETRKLARFLDEQTALVRNIETAAGDLLAHYPHVLPRAEPEVAAFIIIGTERGFCGSFNRALLDEMDSAIRSVGAAAPYVIPVGRKLISIAEPDDRILASLAGASVAEEIEPVMFNIVDALAELQNERVLLSTFCLHYTASGIACKRLLPPFQDLDRTAPPISEAPLLHESPELVLSELADHYLLGALHAALYVSLTAENQFRMNHLDQAIKKIDDESVTLVHAANALRQEDIIEEIEVIMLSASALSEKRKIDR